MKGSTSSSEIFVDPVCSMHVKPCKNTSDVHLSAAHILLLRQDLP